ncbi:MAG: hypothetical protein ABIJ75_07990 [Actinomycetota bacterium]
MSETGDRLRELFTEIAPPIDVERIVQTAGTPARQRRGWLIAVAAAAAVLVVGVGTSLLFGGSGGPADIANEPLSTVTTFPEETTTSAPAGTTTTMPESGPVAQVTLDTTPLSGEWFGTKPDTGGLIVVTTDMIWDGEAFYLLTRLGFGDYVVWRSVDGVAWERYETIAEAGALGITGVWSGPTELVSADGRLIAAGNANGRATVWVDDGSSPWRGIDVGPGAVRNLLYFDGRFVALVDSGEESAVDRRPSAWASSDGEDWSLVAGEEIFGATNWTSELVSGSAGLLTVGFESDPNRPEGEVSGVFLSRDGVSWTRIEPDGLALTQADSIIGSEYGYAVVGLDSPILVSVDGVRWTPVGDLPVPDPTDGVTMGEGLGVLDGRLVLVGGVNFVPEDAEFNTTHPRVWSYAGNGEWVLVGEHPWFDGPGFAYQVVTGDGVMVVRAETQTGGPEDWALLTFGTGERGAVGTAHPLHLYVSNQSFEIDPVGIEIYIDGELEISQEFEVLGQHNWILFEFEIAEGPHEIRAVALNAEADLEESFEVAEETWAVIDFWGTEADDGPFFRWLVQTEPVGFG